MEKKKKELAEANKSSIVRFVYIHCTKGGW